MNYQILAFEKLICTICSAIIPYKSIRHKVRYMLNPLNDQRVEKYFRKQYVLPFLKEQHTFSLAEGNVETEYIWQCWLQGRSQAPDLVKFCMQSVLKYKKKNQKVVVITAENFADYVKLPSLIIEKWNKGIIKPAHFADILRVNLLANYGGYWIDATCLLTNNIPAFHNMASLFMFHSYGAFSYTLIQNCFIYSKPHDYLVQVWCLLINQFWIHEKKALHYFQHHLMFKALIDIDPKAIEEFQKMPIISEKDTQEMMKFIQKGAPFSFLQFKRIKSKIFIHKLTYKESVPKEFYPFYLSNQ